MNQLCKTKLLRTQAASTPKRQLKNLHYEMLSSDKVLGMTLNYTHTFVPFDSSLLQRIINQPLLNHRFSLPLLGFCPFWKNVCHYIFSEGKQNFLQVLYLRGQVSVFFLKPLDFEEKRFGVRAHWGVLVGEIWGNDISYLS